jgi:hypothetical protein
MKSEGITMGDLPDMKRENPKVVKHAPLRMSDLPDANTRKKREKALAPNRKIGDVLQDGAWKGQRCFIVGGGESVKDFDLKKIEGEHTIGINLAFRLFNPEIIFGMDARLWGWIESNETGPKDKELFDKCHALKVWSNATEAPLPEDIIIAPVLFRQGMSPTIKEGLGAGTNSGFGALNLALCLGASEIYLIGFDFYGERWHNGYPSKGEAGNDFHRQCYEEHSVQIKEFGSRIINLNPKSHLKIFEFGELPKNLKPAPSQRVRGANEPIFVSFYTPENGYKSFSDDLKKSLEKLNIEYDIQPIKNRGDWDANTKAKPEFILKMLERYPNRNVVWIDADAYVLSFPEKIMDLGGGDVDFAFGYRHKKDELISSIMFFRNNENSRKLLKKTQALIETGEKHPYGEQIFFQKAMKSFIGEKGVFTATALPEEYCDILGISTPEKPTIIEMRQASRTLKT